MSTLETSVSSRGVATVVLSRPAQLNAFNQEMLDGLTAIVSRWANDDAVRVLVLRAAGKHFSAGAEMARPPEPEVKHTAFIDLFLATIDLPKPSIALVQGACVGGSAALAACFDVVIARKDAFFSIPQVRAGVAPVGVTPVLVRAMGLDAYKRHALAGDRFDAVTAQRYGFVHEVRAAAEIEGAHDRMVENMLLGAPSAQRDVKAFLARTYPSLRQELLAAREHHARTDSFASPDALEGIAAFKEGRRPSWYQPA